MTAGPVRLGDQGSLGLQNTSLLRGCLQWEASLGPRPHVHANSKPTLLSKIFPGSTRGLTSSHM